MRVMIVYEAMRGHDLLRKCDAQEIAEADLVIGLNDEGSEGVILKSRHGHDEGQAVKVVS